jgi:hypothetical protein
VAGKKPNLLSLLGRPVPYEHVIIVYLPNKDKDGTEFDVEPWETEVLKLDGRLFRGATSYPSRGSYRKSSASGKTVEEDIMLEQTRMVTSFAREDDFTEAALKEIAAFMRRFKHETNQDAVAMVVDGEMYYL